jgi:hypothetical protein
MLVLAVGRGEANLVRMISWWTSQPLYLAGCDSPQCTHVAACVFGRAHGSVLRDCQSHFTLLGLCDQYLILISFCLAGSKSILVFLL